jgi:hypothetical protein
LCDSSVLVAPKVSSIADTVCQSSFANNPMAACSTSWSPVYAWVGEAREKSQTPAKRAVWQRKTDGGPKKSLANLRISCKYTGQKKIPM